MRVAVIGAGAVGLGLGSCLLSAGEAVHFIARRSDRRSALKSDGLFRSGIFGDAHYPAGCFELSASVESLRGAPLDAILVCTKAPDSGAVARALESIWPSLEPAAALNRIREVLLIWTEPPDAGRGATAETDNPESAATARDDKIAAAGDDSMAGDPEATAAPDSETSTDGVTEEVEN